MKAQKRKVGESLLHDIETFKRVFDTMPKKFSSAELAERLRIHKVRSTVIANQNMILHLLCYPAGENPTGNRNRVWRKREVESEFEWGQTEPTKPTPPTEEECIALLKSTGKYKISRVTWEEI